MSVNQRIHEFLGKAKLIKYADCIERGCEKYHGNSPSQAMEFVDHQFAKDWRKQFADDHPVNTFQIHSDSFNPNDR